MTGQVRLAGGDTELVLLPARGGGIAAFRWRGADIFRPATGGALPQDLACFPLVPFSNRIDQGHFVADGRDVRLPANLPGVVQPHAIHGFGWQSAWNVVQADQASALLRHDHAAGDWPWAYRAEQHFWVDADGFTCALSLRNDADAPMPTGLGLHPYFPRANARLVLAATGRWDKGADELPLAWRALASPPDWLGGAAIDHVFTGSGGTAAIEWPGRRLTMSADEALAFTVVFVPDGEDYFCVEPVSHMTDAVNRPEPPAVTGLRWLAPGELWEVAVRFAMREA
jgi:aldose 1-epimerase